MQCSDVGKLFLRLGIGVPMLFHGISKTFYGGAAQVAEMFSGMGIPGFLAYGVIVGEFLAAIMVILGLWSRAGGLLISFTMLVAILVAHTGDIFTVAQGGAWGIELQAMYLLGGLAIFCLGAGKHAVMKEGKWN